MTSCSSITSDGYTLHYEVRGRGASVLFIQGAGLHGAGWEPQVSELSTSYTCATFDNRGMGRSQPHVGALTIEQMAADAVAIMDALGWESAHVVGHSMGGLIARYYVKRLGGDRYVRSLVTLGTPHHGSPMAIPGILTLGAFSRAIWQLAPMSPFIRRLKQGPFPPSTKLVSVYSKADRICPYPTCMLEVTDANIKNILLDGEISHRDLLTKKSIYDIVRAEIEDGRPRNKPVEIPADGSPIVIPQGIPRAR